MIGEAEQPELRDLQEERYRLTTLAEHPGWKYFIEIADAQLETRKQQVFLTPLKSLDETLEQEYQKGEISGISFMRHFVEVRVNILAEEITELLKVQEKDNDGRDESSTSEFDFGGE